MRKLQNKELGRKTVEEYRNSVKSRYVIILDNIRSQSNVGSVFRTADAFLTGTVYLCGITARPPHREIQKTALGATESVSWEYFSDTIDAVRKLRDDGFRIIGVEQCEGSVALGRFRPSEGERYALIFGNEINGIDQHVLDECDHILEIPQFGTKHSFNIAVSAGIVLWELNRQLD